MEAGDWGVGIVWRELDNGVVGKVLAVNELTYERVNGWLTILRPIRDQLTPPARPPAASEGRPNGRAVGPRHGALGQLAGFNRPGEAASARSPRGEVSLGPGPSLRRSAGPGRSRRPRRSG